MIERELRAVPGVLSATIDPVTESARIEYHQDLVCVGYLAQVIRGGRASGPAAGEAAR